MTDHHAPMPAPDATERELGALRYVLAEMGRAEAAAFEQRLDGDQALREAVAHAVLLVQAAAELPAMVPVRTTAAPRGAVRWRRVAAAAAILVACASALFVGEHSPRVPATLTAHATLEAERLLVLWLDAADEDAADADGDVESGGDLDARGDLDAAEERDPEDDLDPGHEAGTEPEWMLLGLLEGRR